jgi:hypothetical protein
MTLGPYDWPDIYPGEGRIEIAPGLEFVTRRDGRPSLLSYAYGMEIDEPRHSWEHEAARLYSPVHVEDIAATTIARDPCFRTDATAPDLPYRLRRDLVIAFQVMAVPVLHAREQKRQERTRLPEGWDSSADAPGSAGEPRTSTRSSATITALSGSG